MRTPTRPTRPKQDDEDDADDEGDRRRRLRAQTVRLHGVWEGNVAGIKSMLESMGLPDAGIDIPDSAPYKMTIVVDERGWQLSAAAAPTEIMGQSQTEDLGDISFNAEPPASYVDHRRGRRRRVHHARHSSTATPSPAPGKSPAAMTGITGTWSPSPRPRRRPEVEDEDEAEPVVDRSSRASKQRAIMLRRSQPGNFGAAQPSTTRISSSTCVLATACLRIKLYDIKDEEDGSEKNVLSGVARGYRHQQAMARSCSSSLRPAGPLHRQNAASGAVLRQAGRPPIRMVSQVINPRNEWKTNLPRRLAHPARSSSTFENMHGVDWDEDPRTLRRHGGRLRHPPRISPTSFLARLIAELNIGHAYYGGGDGEDEASSDERDRRPARRATSSWSRPRTASPTRSPRSTRARPGTPTLATRSASPRHRCQGRRLPARRSTAPALDTDVDPWASFIGLAGQVRSNPHREREGRDRR